MKEPDEEEDQFQNDDYYNNGGEPQDGMESRFPGSSREGRDTGRALGVDFPYVPGDPFW